MKKNINTRIKNFYKRWNIVYDENKKFSGFKNCALSTIDKYVGNIFLSDNNLEQRFLKIIQIHIPQSRIGAFPNMGKISEILGVREFKNSNVYKIISGENDFVEFIKCLQVLFWLDLGSEVKEELYFGFKEDIEISLLDIRITKIKNNGIIFQPKGAKLLDEKVVNDVLNWLTSYNIVCKNFKSALEKYQNKIYQRNLIDDLRLSLELLLKEILNNEKSLENQKKPLGKYLEEKNIPKELRNMYWQLINYYTNYQNNYAKHNDKVSSSEIEFLIYLTGVFIRFLITLEDSKDERK